MRRGLLTLCVLTACAAAQNTAEIAADPQAVRPPMGVPALTLPPDAGGGGGAGAPGPAAPPQLEVTAIELIPGAPPMPVDDRLKGFKLILERLGKDYGYRVVAQEAKEAPLQVETDWSIDSRHAAHVLPIEQTPDGAVRLDARVSLQEGGRSLNALRAEGEVPARKVMAFRGLTSDGGHELVLLLRQAPGENEQQGGESAPNQDNEDEPRQQQEENLASKQDDQPSDQPQGEQEEPSQTEQQQTEEIAEQGEGESADAAEEDSGPKDAHAIEALLKALEEEDMRQQQEARFNRKNIILPDSGDWW